MKEGDTAILVRKYEESENGNIISMEQYINGDIFVYLNFGTDDYKLWAATGQEAFKVYDKIEHMFKHKRFELSRSIKYVGNVSSFFYDTKQLIEDLNMNLFITNRPEYAYPSKKENGKLDSIKKEVYKYPIRALDFSEQDNSLELSKLDVLKGNLTDHQIKVLKKRLESTIPYTDFITNNIDRIVMEINRLDINFIYNIESYKFKLLGYDFGANHIRGRNHEDVFVKP